MYVRGQRTLGRVVESSALAPLPARDRSPAAAIYSGRRFGDERVARLVCGSTNRALDHPGSNPVPSVFPCTKCVGMGIEQSNRAIT
jgi:hypothetical protein